jgi:iron(III) transport system permease protein
LPRPACDAAARRAPASWPAPAALLAWCACALPLAGGFVLPGGLLLAMALTDGDAQFGERFLRLAGNSVLLAGLTALLAWRWPC